MRLFLTPALTLLAALAAMPALPALARGALPPGFVYLHDVAPGIAQEIRYATAVNFTGRPLPGYGSGECVLRRDAGEALARVEADLARRHLGLKTYDCYRPERAVAAMWRWSQDGRADGDKRFYPNTDKLRLFSLGYIASHSRHSTGTAVDLTLIALDAPSSEPRGGGPCTAPARERIPDNSLDMGTGFDCLDVKSYTHSPKVTADERHDRDILNKAMAARGFRNYFREWWHYEYTGGAPRKAYDVPIAPR